MTWILLLTIIFLLAAVVLIELRAVHAGDERRHHAPGYGFVLGGLVALATAIGLALMDETALALLLSTLGLIAVGVGTLRDHRYTGPYERGHLH
jgi:uncharacterized membrane protein YhaH (DUF805 family)